MRFLRPDLAQWWLLLPVLVASWALHHRVTSRLRRLAPLASRFAPLSRRSTWVRSAVVLTASLAAAGALVLALMRPQVLLNRRLPDYERQDLIVILDRSASMRAHDISPSRFSRATLEIRNLLRHKPEAIDRVALVGFADASVILSYLTGDIESVFFYLDWIDGDPRPLFGTNIGAALKSAMEVVKKDGRPTQKLLLLVSDGEDHAAELKQSLASIRAEGYRVHCIGIGTQEDVPIPLRRPDGQETFLRDDDGRLVTTRFEESTLREIAASTGGRYVRSTTGDELARAIADIVKGERKQVGWRTATEYRDVYQAGLAVAGVAGAALWLLL